MDIETLKNTLLQRVGESKTPNEILKAAEFRELYAKIPTLAPEERGPFGRQVNELKQAIEAAIQAREATLEESSIRPIDVTAPFDVNAKQPTLLPSENGTTHPLMQEIQLVSDIFNRMGFVTEESREIETGTRLWRSQCGAQGDRHRAAE